MQVARNFCSMRNKCLRNLLVVCIVVIIVLSYFGAVYVYLSAHPDSVACQGPAECPFPACIPVGVYAAIVLFMIVLLFAGCVLFVQRCIYEPCVYEWQRAHDELN